MMLIRNTLLKFYHNNKDVFAPAHLGAVVLGTAIGSFGLYNIHRQADITEGGVLGLILLLNHWLGLSPSILSPLLDLACYAVAIRFLGAGFLKTTLLSTVSLALFFRLWEQFPPILPSLAPYPFVAAVAGGAFIGTGVGILMRQGGAGSGDDALAMTISKVTGWRISRAYMATDFTVLLLSLSYLSFGQVAYSVVTVTVSSLLIDFIHNYGRKKAQEPENAKEAEQTE